MTAVLRTLDRLGVVALRELLRARYDRQYILMLAEYRRIERVRFGWYALPDNDPAVLAAWRVGGRLGCVSALAYYGLVRQPGELHVAVNGNASRLRKRAGDVIHWSRLAGGEDRRVVSLEMAVRQASRCACVTRDSL